jgi:D-lactate dehydrogenase (quinone)
MDKTVEELILPGATDPALMAALRATVGRRHVIDRPDRQRRYTTGYRSGKGRALAVVRPGTLIEMWRVLQHCCAADVVVILQAANTGLTGGSTPLASYERPAVVINTMRIKGIHLLDDARQVVCLPGATLDELERTLLPHGREPHSVIGSSCIGASVLGGVCNNSGGSLVRRGPAYTELALYARQGLDGTLRLVNHLGLDLGEEPETILRRVEAGDFADSDIDRVAAGRGSDAAYAQHVRAIDAATPARFNADPARLFEASGSAGRIALMAVRLDTFPAIDAATTFYIGTNDSRALAGLRRDLLTGLAELPISGEYIHRDAYDLAERYGRDTAFVIERFGTRFMPAMFAAKARVDAAAARWRILPDNLGDVALQWAGRVLPGGLPPRMQAWRDRFEHHLILKVAGDQARETGALLDKRLREAEGDYFVCTPHEAAKAFLHRFAVAGAAVRYAAIQRKITGGIIALDIALPRNTPDWVETLPEHIQCRVAKTAYYGHFLCHVFHQDYVLKHGVDAAELKADLLEQVAARGAEYPAEHNVGHQYRAKPALVEHYRQLDPGNRFNPGIGQTTISRDWRE